MWTQQGNRYQYCGSPVCWHSTLRSMAGGVDLASLACWTQLQYIAATTVYRKVLVHHCCCHQDLGPKEGPISPWQESKAPEFVPHESSRLSAPPWLSPADQPAPAKHPRLGYFPTDSALPSHFSVCLCFGKILRAHTSNAPLWMPRT